MDSEIVPQAAHDGGLLPPMTFTVERRDDSDGLWLCVDDGTASTPIARFADETVLPLFWHATKLAFQKAHWIGSQGM